MPYKNPEAKRKNQKRIWKTYWKKHRYGSIEGYDTTLQKYSGKCVLCQKVAQLVHHIDGKNFRNSPREKVNNDSTNLLPLCMSCHMWLHNRLRRIQKGGPLTVGKICI